jgi:NAD(P)H-hydrate epimerase
LLARGSELKDDAARAYGDYVRAGGLVVEVLDENALAAALGEPPAVVVDAIFGTGLNAEVSGVARSAIETINQLARPTVAVDIASGVNADTGAIMGAAARAALSVTFGYAKYGHVSYPGAEFCGELEVVDIGFAPDAIGEVAPRGRMIERADATLLVTPRQPNTHKGTYGHALVIVGGRGKAGAAILTSRGALRTGAGLVTAAIPECVAAIVATGQAELMTEPMPDREGHFDGPATIEGLAKLVNDKNALIVGPGIGVSDDAKLLVEWLVKEGAQPTRPLLIDADGLNVLTILGPAILKSAQGPVAITPHPGEMARLLKSGTGAVNADRVGAARQFAELTGAAVLLKGARTVVAAPDGTVSINSSGNPGMATPGMGDALSGIIGALLGQGMNRAEALRLGAFIHGFAADNLAARIGPVGYLAGDVVDEVPRALGSLMA